MSDSGTWSVRVVDEDGNGVSGVKVSYQCGAMSGVGTEYTDYDGWAEFEIVNQVLGGGPIAVHRIWVDGEEVSDDHFYPEDGDTFSFVRP